MRRCFSPLAGTACLSMANERRVPSWLQAVLVLFDLPDFMIISAYVLLALVWAEAFIQSRNHWLSVKHFRRLVPMIGVPLKG